MRTATTPTDTGLCHLSWCNGAHEAETRSYRSHLSELIHDGPSRFARFARISWEEPLDAAARFTDRGPQVFVWVSGAEMRLTVRETESLQKMLRASGAEDVAEFVGRVIAVAAGEDGGERRG